MKAKVINNGINEILGLISKQNPNTKPDKIIFTLDLFINKHIPKQKKNRHKDSDVKTETYKVVNGYNDTRKVMK